MNLACAYMCDAGISFTIGEVDIERLDVRDLLQAVQWKIPK